MQNVNAFGLLALHLAVGFYRSLILIYPRLEEVSDEEASPLFLVPKPKDPPLGN